MKSDLHETFSVFQDRSPESINNVHARARAHVHAQCVKKCTQLGQLDTTQFLSQINLDFVETWYDLRIGNKDAAKIFWEQYVHARTRKAHKRACTFL